MFLANMRTFTGIGRDLRNGAIISVFVVCIFIVILAAQSDTTLKTSSMFEVIGTASAESVPVVCHHFFREDIAPFEVYRIVGALFLNLPLIDDMNVWTQTRSSFEKQIRYLKEHGYTTVSLDDLVAWRSGRKKLPKKSVVITFDDGDRSVLEVAYPILEKYRMKATLFVVTSYVGKNKDGIRGLTWDELRFLRDSGVFTIESHTNGLHFKVKTTEGHLPVAMAMSEGLYTPDWDESWRAAVLHDLEESRRLIAENLGRQTRHLSWPYGFSNSRLDSLASSSGFESVATLRYGGNLAARGYEIKRYTITSRTSLRSFARMVP